MTYAKMGFEKVFIKWPKRLKEDGTLNQFTVKDILKLNDVGTPEQKVSHVTVNAKIAALLQLGAIEVAGERRTKGRPVKLYQFVGYYNPVPLDTNDKDGVQYL